MSVSGYWFFVKRNTDQIPGNNQTKTAEQPNTPTEEASGFDKSKYSLTEPASIWVVVNKKNALPIGYKPADLTVPNVALRLSKTHEQMQFSGKAVPDLEAMFAAAQKDGVELVFGSAYRSGVLQKQFYDSYVARDGRDKADTYSARPGHSEHQTGLAVDITRADGKCHLEKCFEDTPEGKWIAANSYKYGFILRYLEGKEAITGYTYEPWHLRFVGRELALEMNKHNMLTLEEFFGLPPAPTY